MGQITNVIIGLATALIGYIVGRLWQRLVDWLPYRRARLFFGPVMKGELQIVTSRFRASSFPDGLVGGGDALALREISTFFNKIGFKRFETVYVDERILDRRKNLVLLGGLDTNQVTMDAISLVNTSLTISDPGPGIKMEVHDLAADDICAEGELEGEPPIRKFRATETVDYGIVIRTRNPFNPRTAIIIIAGAYGYGTWAGSEIIQQDFFLRRCEELDRASATQAPRKSGFVPACTRLAKTTIRRRSVSESWTSFECVFRVRVYDDRPVVPEIMLLRSLAAVN